MEPSGLFSRVAPVTPVWINLDGDTLVINTANGRQNVRKLDRDGRVAIRPEVETRHLPDRARACANEGIAPEKRISCMICPMSGEERWGTVELEPEIEAWLTALSPGRFGQAAF